MAILKFKDKGEWKSIAAFKGEPGKDGAIQYTAGKGITIENDTISAEVDKQYVDEAIAGMEIPEEDLDGMISPIFNVSLPGFIETDDMWVQKTGVTDAAVISSFQKMYNYCKKNNINSPIISTARGIGITSSDILSSATLTYNFIRHSSYSNTSKTRALTITASMNMTDDIIKSINFTVRTNNGDYLKLANSEEYTPSGDYHPATKKYVDDAVANSSSGGGTSVECVYNLTENKSLEPFKGVNVGLGNSNVPGLRAALKQSLNAGHKNFMINIRFSKTGEKLELRCIIDGETIEISCWKAWYIYNGSYVSFYNPINVGGISNISEIDTADYFVRLNFKNNCVFVPDSSRLITKDNTTEFTPTSDYHPATKKYVDDAISAVITTALEADY